jgi:hypothetical protein
MIGIDVRAITAMLLDCGSCLRPGPAGPIGAVDPLRNDALAKPPCLGERGWPIFGNASVKQDAGLSVARESARPAFRSRKKVAPEGGLDARGRGRRSRSEHA